MQEHSNLENLEKLQKLNGKRHKISVQHDVDAPEV